MKIKIRFSPDCKYIAFIITGVICLILISGRVEGQSNYYFSSSKGDDSRSSAQAKNPATPWRTISKLNSYFENIKPGDSILFQRGDTLYGSLFVEKSGTSFSPIVISAYGTGPKPVITGFSTISSWISLGNNIYEAVVPNFMETVNCVVINGMLQPVGRYPKKSGANGGYLSFESHSGDGQITDNQLAADPDWTGGEIVIRKNHWIIDRTRIISHKGTVINFTPVTTYYKLIDKSGYFIQNHPSTLTQNGDWCYNYLSKKIQIYYTTVPPEIKVSTMDQLVRISSNSYINISDIAFEGANTKAVYASDAVSVSMVNCDVNYSGTHAVHFNKMSGDIQFNNNTISNSLNNAVTIQNRYVFSYCTIRNNTILNTALFPGMGSTGDGSYMAMSINAEDGAVIEYNTIKNSGYIPIQFSGNNILIKNNITDNYLLTKQDGGGIYTWNGTNPVRIWHNRIIIGNIVSNGIGNADGTVEGKPAANGIYMDNNVNHVDIIDNTVFNISGMGSHNNSTSSVKMTGNTFFNVAQCLNLVRWVDDGSRPENGGQDITDLNIQNNTFFTTSVGQTACRYGDKGVNFPTVSTIEERISSMGIIDNNYYHLPNVLGFGYYYQNDQSGPYVSSPQLSFNTWRSFTGYEQNSVLIPAIPSYHINNLVSANLYASGQFSDNISGVSSYSLSNNHILGWDNTSKITGTGSLKVSFKTAPLSPNDYVLMYAFIGSVNSAKNYILRFSTLGTTENGTVRVCFRKTDSPYSSLTSTQLRPFGTSRTDHEFLIKAPASYENASWQIDILQASGTTYIDNVEVYEAIVTDVNIRDSVRLEINATKTPRTITLDAKYYSVDRKIYNGSVTLQPFCSVILMKYKGNLTPSIKNQSFKIPDNSTNGTIVGTVIASDPEEDQSLTYSILSGNTNGAFAINTSTGELTIANVAALGPDFVLTVKVQDNGTGNLSSQATITLRLITGIESPEINKKIKVYPNPVSDELIIEMDGNIKKPDFKIINSIGKIVYEGRLSEKTVVQTANFSRGIYFIRFHNGISFEFKKVVKI